MKHNKGFTLTELLITLALIVLVGLIIVNNIIGITKKNDEKDYVNFVSKLEKSACTFIELDSTDIVCDDYCLVSVQDLIAQGLIEEDMINPKTNKKLDPLENVYVYHKNKEKLCLYKEDGIYDMEPPIITYTKENYEVFIIITDNSNLKGYKITTDANKPEEFETISGNAFSTKYNITEIGTFYIHAIDQYNNYAVKEFTIVPEDLDTTPPTVEVFVDNNIATATLMDNYQLAGYIINNESEPPEDFSGYKSIKGMNVVVTSTLKRSGHYYVHAIDQAGLTATADFEYNKAVEWEFACEQKVRKVNIIEDGVYRFDVYGGLGGGGEYISLSANTCSGHSEAGYAKTKYNSYVEAYYELKAGTTIYINVGCGGAGGQIPGEGAEALCPTINGKGGYNGGLKGSGGGGSGGATTVAFTDEMYSTSLQDSANLIISAKGGYGVRVNNLIEYKMTPAGAGKNYANSNVTGYLNHFVTEYISLPDASSRVTISLVQKEHKMMYNNNGGTGCKHKTINFMDSYGTLCTPTRENYNFVGWYDQTGELVDASKILERPEDIYLTAKWQSKMICRRATTLHSELCSQTNKKAFCSSEVATINGSDIINNSLIYFGQLNNGPTYHAGDVFDCDVNGDEIFDPVTERFYYVTDLDSNTAVLIYYNNISYSTNLIKPNKNKSYAYATSNSNLKGPNNSVTKLPTTTQWGKTSLTKTKRNILNIDGTIKLENFDYTNHTARLLTKKELDEGCNITSNGTVGEFDIQRCRYLLENTVYVAGSSKAGYLLETPYSNDSQVYGIHGNTRKINYFNANDEGYGVRPVIEVPKSSILSTIQNDYTLYYDSEGGLGCTTQKVSFGSPYGKLCVPKRTGFTFKHWVDEAGNIIDESSNYELLSDKKLKAVWSADYICRRAITLHTETCLQSSSNSYCSSKDVNQNGTDIKMKDIITYGNLGDGDVLNSGDAFDCDVNNDSYFDPLTERFYYVTDLNNDTGVLIYYSNIKFDSNAVTYTPSLTKNYNYYTANTATNIYGPLTAITKLPTTSYWSKTKLTNSVRDILDTDGNVKVSNFNYGSNLAARLITKQEIEKACGTINGTKGELDIPKCRFLFEQSSYANTTEYTNANFWLETTDSTPKSKSIHVINSSSRSLIKQKSTDNCGVKPVIEVPKTQIDRKLNYILSFDNNGGMGCFYKSVTYNEPFGELCVPTKEGYTFDGWYDEYGIRITKDTLLTKEENITLKAYWKLNCVSGNYVDYVYTGIVEPFVAGCDGTYQIEVVGARAYNKETKGNYNSAYFKLKENDILYFAVGNKAKINGTNLYNYGSTHVSTLKSTWIDNDDNVLITARSGNYTSKKPFGNDYYSREWNYALVNNYKWIYQHNDGNGYARITFLNSDN